MAVERPFHVVIAGGGIAGLAAAFRLQQRAPELGRELAVTLIESEPRLGGKIVTERVDGFVVEGGPDTFLAYKPRGVGLCRELGLAERLHGTNQQLRRTYVMRSGRLYDLPEGLTGLVPSRFGPMARSGLISPLGKLRMGLEYLVPARRDESDESLADFVTRRLGRELYDRMIEPLLSGIYAGDGEQLSLAATFPQLREYERAHGGLIRGMLAARRRGSGAPGAPGASGANGAGGANGARPGGSGSNGAGPNGAGPNGAAPRWSAFVTPTTGLAEIVEALVARLSGRADLRTGARAVGLASRWDAPGYSITLDRGAPLVADALILATPAYASAALLGGLDDGLAEALRTIPYVSTATVTLAYPLSDIPRPLDGYGYIIPRAEQRAILACTWTSTKFPHRAPEGWGLIRAFIGRGGQEDALAGDDASLIALVRAELRAVLGVRVAPQLARVFRWPQAMPQYTLGHLERLATIEARLAGRPRLALAGNAYRGIGVPDCILSGESAAERVLAAVAERSLAC